MTTELRYHDNRRPLTFDTYRDTENGDTAETIRYLRERVRVLHARVKELEEKEESGADQ